MLPPQLASAIKSVPPGKWAVAVSGGADSIALLAMLRSRCDLQLHVVHLNHQTRGQQSDDDSSFVADTAANWKLPSSVVDRDQLEPTMSDLPANLSARFRALRIALFDRAVREHRLDGVLVAHHADDQAETILHRLLRGSGYEGLCGMGRRTRFDDLRVLRPLLDISRADLRAYLQTLDQRWREDPSNASDKYVRNRLRRFLASKPDLTHDLLALSQACQRLRRWTRANAPRLDMSFAAGQLADLPALLARESARVWLIERGISPGDITSQSLDRLIEMTADAASPARADFPGKIVVRRRRGMLFAEGVATN